MKAIIFDCDGTLVDSETLSTEVLVEAVGEHGLDMTVPEALAAFRGGKMADCIADLETRLGRPLPSTFVPDFRARSAEAFRSRLRAIDGALELVQSLSMLPVPFCVASSGPMAKIELSLTLTGLLPFFDGRIFSSYDVGTWKPDPGLFLHAADALGVAPGDCAVIEDSLPGMLAGLAAGMTVFAFQPHGVDPRTPPETLPLMKLLDLRERLAASATREDIT
ncbi:MAG: HAD-IA family hydrolase [Vicinamibacterales bacterium]